MSGCFEAFGNAKERFFLSRMLRLTGDMASFLERGLVFSERGLIFLERRLIFPGICAVFPDKTQSVRCGVWKTERMFKSFLRGEETLVRLVII